MFRLMGRLAFMLALAGGLLLLSPALKATNVGGGVAWAQATDGFNTSYFDKRAGGGTVSITNPLEPPIVCALIYVFRQDEQLEECCGCPVTNSGGLRTIRLGTVIHDYTFESVGGAQFPTAINQSSDSPYDTLTDNPENNQLLDRGDIKILSSLPNGAGGSCDPTLPPSNGTTTPGPVNVLREYMTSFQANFVTSLFPFGVTEHQFQAAPDPTNTGEVASLDFFCSGIFALQSGLGICGCGRGDNAPASPHVP